VGFMLKGGIFVGGYGQTLQDTRYRPLIWGWLGDLKAKLPYLHGEDHDFL
jgi:hypothetical protein